MGFDSTGSYKVFGGLCFTLYISSYVMLSGLKFIFRFKSKSTFHSAGVELYNGSVGIDQKTSCTNKPESSMKNNKNKGKQSKN